MVSVLLGFSKPGGGESPGFEAGSWDFEIKDIVSRRIEAKWRRGELSREGRASSRTLQAQSSEHVSDHDFPNPEVPKAVPYGIYELGANLGRVAVGADHNCVVFARFQATIMHGN